MNIEQANAVPIILLLDSLNIKPSRTSGNDYYYLAPWRNEKTASLHVQAQKNVWYDHGIGEGGDCVVFVCKHLKESNEDYTVSDALRWIENMSGQGRFIQPIPVQYSAEPEPRKTLRITKIEDIDDNGLMTYLESRGIPVNLGKKYLKQVRIYNAKSKRHFIALGFANDDGGYELRNSYFKSCYGSKQITFIRGTNPRRDNVHVVEGFMDFLSVVCHEGGEQLTDDAIILNSLVNLKIASPYIKYYGYQIAYTWMDNDNAGKAARKSLDEFFQSEPGLHHRPMNRLYEPHKDVNAWHMKKMNLAPQVE